MVRRRMHHSIPEQGTYLGAVVQGHAQYYGVPWNGPVSSSSALAQVAELNRHRSLRAEAPE